jgi:hypothetical protein
MRRHTLLFVDLALAVLHHVSPRLLLAFAFGFRLM